MKNGCRIDPHVARFCDACSCATAPYNLIDIANGYTAVTHLVQAGVDLPTVQKISGHKTLSMVARYAHANGAHIDAAMAQLETRIGARKVGPITPELHKGSSTA